MVYTLSQRNRLHAVYMEMVGKLRASLTGNVTSEASIRAPVTCDQITSEARTYAARRSLSSNDNEHTTVVQSRPDHLGNSRDSAIPIPIVGKAS